MSNILQLTVQVVARNADDLKAIANSVEKLGAETLKASPGADKLGAELRELATTSRGLDKSLLDLRKRNDVLSKTIGRQRNALIRATDAQREAIKAGLNAAISQKRLNQEKLTSITREKQHVALLQREARELAKVEGASRKASGGTGLLSNAVGGLVSNLGAFVAFDIIHVLREQAAESIRAAGAFQQYRHATEQILGSAQAATQRIEELVEVANMPGLNFEALVRYSNRLMAAGVTAADTDKILLGVGQTIVNLGGSAATADLAMEQLIQAFQLGSIDMRDFRTIIQQIPGFLEAAGDVHGVQANIEGLREAFNRTGQEMRDLIIPVFDHLNEKFASPPPDSYIRVMDEFQNSLFLVQAAIGEKFLPVFLEATAALTDFFQAIRAGTQDITTLPEPIQELVAGARELYEGFQAVVVSIAQGLGPETKKLLAALGSLLGNVLSLAGTLLEALAPALRLIATLASALLAPITKVANIITTLVGGTVDLLDAAQRAAQFANQSGTQSQATQDLSGRGVDPYYHQLQEHLTGLEGPVSELEQKFEGLKTESRALSSEFETLSENITKVEAPLVVTNAAMREFVPSMRELSEISETVRDEFDVLAPTAERVRQIFETYNETLHKVVATSGIFLTNLKAEREALESISAQFMQATQDAIGLAAAQERLAQRTDAHNAALVNPAVSEAARDALQYAGNLSAIGVSYEEVGTISERVTQKIRENASAMDEFSRSIKNTEQQLESFDKGLDKLDEIGPTISRMGSVLRELRDSWLDTFSALSDAVADFIRDLRRIDDERAAGQQRQLDLQAQFVADYNAVERDMLEQLRELEEERVALYQETRSKIIEINTELIDELRTLGISSNRSRLDETVEFYDELQQIEATRQGEREVQSEEHVQRLLEIEQNKNRSLLGSSEDFAQNILEIFEGGRFSENIGALNRELSGFLEGLIGGELGNLTSIEGFRPLDLFELTDIQNLTGMGFLQQITGQFGSVIESLRENPQKGRLDNLAADLARSLQGIQGTENAGGILGDARTAELATLNDLAVEATNVVLNARELILGATDARYEGSRAITEQQNLISAATKEQLNQLVVNYSTEALRLDQETAERVAEAAEQASKSFWGNVFSIASTVVGTVVGTAVGAPHVGFAVGQGVGNIGKAAFFHSPIHDYAAMRAGQDTALSILQRQLDAKSAQDFSNNFGQGLDQGLLLGGNLSGGGQQGGDIIIRPVFQFPSGAVIELADEIVKVQDEGTALPFTIRN